jgi:hypothetical protein
MDSNTVHIPVLQTFTFFPDGAFWPSAVGILPESAGMHNQALGNKGN